MGKNNHDPSEPLDRIRGDGAWWNVIYEAYYNLVVCLKFSFILSV